MLTIAISKGRNDFLKIFDLLNKKEGIDHINVDDLDIPMEDVLYSGGDFDGDDLLEKVGEKS